MLLRDSLGGGSLAIMLACVTPTRSASHESLRTLQFAMGVKLIRNKAVVLLNPQVSSRVRRALGASFADCHQPYTLACWLALHQEKLIAELRQEIRRLREENAMLRQQGAGRGLLPPDVLASRSGDGSSHGGGGAGSPLSIYASPPRLRALEGPASEQRPTSTSAIPIPRAGGFGAGKGGDDDGDDGGDGEEVVAALLRSSYTMPPGMLAEGVRQAREASDSAAKSTEPSSSNKGASAAADAGEESGSDDGYSDDDDFDDDADAAASATNGGGGAGGGAGAGAGAGAGGADAAARSGTKPPLAASGSLADMYSRLGLSAPPGQGQDEGVKDALATLSRPLGLPEEGRTGASGGFAAASQSLSKLELTELAAREAQLDHNMDVLK